MRERYYEMECPCCGERRDIEGDHFDGEGSQAWQRITCLKCGCVYAEVYEYKFTEIHAPGMVRNEHGEELPYELAVNHMDDGLREELHAEIAPCTEQEFFDAYAKLHEECFGEAWFLAGYDIIW